MSARALLLVNPGARRAGEGHEAAARRLERLGMTVSVEMVGQPDDVPAQILRRRTEVDRVIVAGGDGTLHLALQGLVESHLPLGILPLGTANNLARTLGLPTDPMAACDVIAQGHRRRIDLGWVNGRYFFTTASIGLSVKITEELSAESKRRWGPLAYAFTALRVLRRTRPFHARIRWAGGSRDSRTVQIVVGNGRYYGSALPVAEDATIDDARLDLYSLEVRHWWQLLALAPALKRGRQGEKRTVEAIRAPEFEIETRTPRSIDVDGEIGGTTPARLRVLPGALEVFAPLARMA
ncbi:MAG TPA: lipid kinase [Gemmatimonadales bacterium]|nr:lipid kinase [Gemmatimonadales bacterium]